MDTQKQQVAQRVKEANNILVTVSNNPSVDQLAACIGLTLALNKMGKHATAVFSGDIPSTIEFLQPEKTIEKNTDSLRDFIIALDKSKADKLRYKVEDRVVKIFITPYRTSISDKDLEFSQGDFNVDVVLALGVHAQADLDQAITAHGRILHDATVVTMNVRPGGELGSMNWLDPNASSLSELAVQLIDMLDKKLIDGQIATSMLTGIVAETERFSNARTSPGTMSISAELMAVGANQQLVATKLEEPAPPPPTPAGPIAQQDAHTGDATDVPPEAKKPDDGTLEIAHDEKQAGQQAAEPPAEPGSESKPPETESAAGPAQSAPEQKAESEAEAKPEPAPEPEQPRIHDVKSDTDGLLPRPDGHAHEDHDDEKEEGLPIEPEKPAAPPAELPAPEPPAEPSVPPQIHIDEHGALSPLSSESSDEADEALLPPLKPQEPPTISHHDEAPKMVLEPPSMGGQLTAGAGPGAFGAASGEDEDQAAGLPGMPAHDMPMLGNGQGLPGSAGAPPAMPAPNETLTDIERDVHSSHLAAGTDAVSPSAPAAAEPVSATEPAFIETPLPPSAPPAPPAPGPGLAVDPFAASPPLPASSPLPQPPAPSAPPMTSPAPPAPAPDGSGISVVGPDDLTPDEVASAFAVGDNPPANNNSAPGAPPAAGGSNPIDTTPTPVPGPAANGYADLDTARDAVAQAINGSATPPLESIEALNANPLGPPLGGGGGAAPGAPGAALPADPFAAAAAQAPAAPPAKPWMPPVEPAPPAPPAPAGVAAGAPGSNPATQFDPAAFAAVDDPTAPPPVPPPMMPAGQA